MNLDKDLLTKEKFMEILETKVGNPSGLHYEKAYDRFKEGRIVTFNWSAFIWGSTWLCYRQLYKYALILFFVNPVLYFSIGFITEGGNLLGFYNQDTSIYMIKNMILLLFLAERICFGFFGNYIFISNVVRRLKNNDVVSNGPNMVVAITWLFFSPAIEGLLCKWLILFITFLSPL